MIITDTAASNYAFGGGNLTFQPHTDAELFDWQPKSSAAEWTSNFVYSQVREKAADLLLDSRNLCQYLGMKSGKVCFSSVSLRK